MKSPHDILEVFGDKTTCSKPFCLDKNLTFKAEGVVLFLGRKKDETLYCLGLDHWN